MKKKMTNKSKGLLTMLSVSALIICYVTFKLDFKKHPSDAPYLDEDYIFTKYELDTVDVDIDEDYVRWYTIDTVWYEVVEPVTIFDERLNLPFLFLFSILLITYFINRSGEIWERKFIIDKIITISIATMIIAYIMVFSSDEVGEGMAGFEIIGLVINLGIIIFVWKIITGISKKKGAK